MFTYYGELINPHYKNETQKVDEIKPWSTAAGNQTLEYCSGLGINSFIVNRMKQHSGKTRTGLRFFLAYGTFYI
jgi:hypothetical protein